MAANHMTNQTLECTLADRSKNIELFFARAPQVSAMKQLKTRLAHYLATLKEDQDAQMPCP